MSSLLVGAGLAALVHEIVGLLIMATFFSIATGVGAHLKGRFAGHWMLAGFFLGPLAFVALLLSGDA